MDTNTFLPPGFCSSGSLDTVRTATAERYVMEPKLDGYRLQLHVTATGVRCFTRTGADASGKMPAVDALLAPYLTALDGTILDGEAVIFRADGSADFNATARAMGSGLGECQRKQRASGEFVNLVAFDILAVQGQDVRGLPLADRRALLATFTDTVCSGSACAIRLVPQTAPSLAQHQEFTSAYGEGSVLKALGSRYPRGRSADWIKVKRVHDADVVVMGSAEGAGKFAGQVGAVQFGQYRDGVLTGRGQCSGMTDQVRRDLTRNLPIGAVMTITHNGIQAGGGFRHPQFSHFRDSTDKAAADCGWDE